MFTICAGRLVCNDAGFVFTDLRINKDGDVEGTVIIDVNDPQSHSSVYDSKSVKFYERVKRLLVFEHRFQLLSEFGCVFVAVRGDGMMYGSRHDLFLFTANPESAVFVARILPAVHYFSLTHRIMPPPHRDFSYVANKSYYKSSFIVNDYFCL